MSCRTFSALIILFCLVYAVSQPVLAADAPLSQKSSAPITFFHPSGMNGFIVYDMNPGETDSGLSYRAQTYDLSSPLGVPVRLDVESFSISDGANDIQKVLQDTGSNYLEIFSIQHAFSRGSQSSLSRFNPGKQEDITMVVASANYQASDRFSAKLSTGVSQTLKEESGAAPSLGYELDIAGMYQIAPGLSFSVGAGYATATDPAKEAGEAPQEKRAWSLISKLRLKF